MAEKKRVPPRIVPDRDSKYMAMALIVAGLSKDPSTQIGSLIIDEDNSPLGWGYNGPPAQIDDNAINWDRPDKYDFIIHAEENAIDHSNAWLGNATIYVTGLPCKKCMLRIVSKGIKRVCYLEREYDKNSMQVVSADVARVHEIAKLGGVKLDAFKGNLNWLPDWTIVLRNLGILGGKDK
jgi:dCMP deaminase